MMLPNNYSIRLARKDELTLLREIERQACTRFSAYDFAAAMTDILTPFEYLEQGYNEQRLWVVVFTEQAVETPVGFALAEILGNHAHLDELDVLPEYGQRGLGVALVEAACLWGKNLGFTSITLSTLSNVPWNAPFYARHGFRILANEDLTPELREILVDDTARGLPAKNRVIMRREL